MIELKIGSEFFELSEEKLRKAIEEGLIEGHDLIRSVDHTNGRWLMISDVEPFKTWLVHSSPNEVDYADMPPAKRALIERQKHLETKLKERGIKLECPICGSDAQVVPSAIYQGKLYCKKCERYYNIEHGLD
ncbi:MAG: hypothetical protein ACUVWP_00970 [bacterium]